MIDKVQSQGSTPCGLLRNHGLDYCPKCGSKHLTYTWVAEVPSIIPERFDVGCTTCDYEWHERVPPHRTEEALSKEGVPDVTHAPEYPLKADDECSDYLHTCENCGAGPCTGEKKCQATDTNACGK